MPKELRTTLLPSRAISGKSAGSTVVTHITDPDNASDVLSSFVFLGCSGGPTHDHIGKVFRSLVLHRTLDFVYMTGDFVYPYVSDDEALFQEQARSLLPLGTLPDETTSILADGVVCHLGVGNHEREAFNSKLTLHKPRGFVAGNDKLATLVTHVEGLDAMLGTAGAGAGAGAGAARTINQLNLIPYYVHLVYRDDAPVMFLLVLDSNVPYDAEQLCFLNEVRQVLDATELLAAGEVRFDARTQQAMREAPCRILVTHQSVAPTHGKRYNKSEPKKYDIEGQLDALEGVVSQRTFGFVRAALLRMLQKSSECTDTASELIDEIKTRQGNIHQHVFSVFNAMLGAQLASFLNICAHEHTFCFSQPGYITAPGKQVIPYATVCEGRGGSEDNRSGNHCVSLPPGVHTSDVALAGFSRLTLRKSGVLVLESYDAATNAVILTEELELPVLPGMRILTAERAPHRVTEPTHTTVSLDEPLPHLDKHFFKDPFWEELLSILRVTQDIRYAVLYLFTQNEFVKAFEHGTLKQKESGALISKSLEVDPRSVGGQIDDVDTLLVTLHHLQLAHYARVFPVASIFNMLSALRYVLDVTRTIRPSGLSFTQKVEKAVNAIARLRSGRAEQVSLDMSGVSGAGAGASTSRVSYGTTPPRVDNLLVREGAHTEFEQVSTDFRLDRDTQSLQSSLMSVIKQRYKKKHPQFWQDVLKGDVDLYRYFLLLWLYAKSERPVRLMLIYYFHLASPDPHLQVRLGEQVEAHKSDYSSVFDRLGLLSSDKGADALPRLLAFEKLATQEAIKHLLCSRYFLETLKRFWLGAFKECAEDFSAALIRRNRALHSGGLRVYLPARFFPRAHYLAEDDLQRYVTNFTEKVHESVRVDDLTVTLEDVRVPALSIVYSSSSDRFVCEDAALQSSEIVQLLLAFANAALVEKKTAGMPYSKGHRK